MGSPYSDCYAEAERSITVWQAVIKKKGVHTVMWCDPNYKTQHTALIAAKLKLKELQNPEEKELPLDITAANGERYRVGDKVYSANCEVILRRKTNATYGVVGYCNACGRDHTIDVKKLGKEWTSTKEEKNTKTLLVRADGEDWFKGDRVFFTENGPQCIVTLTAPKDGGPQMLVGWCQVCQEQHLVTASWLGKEWQRYDNPCAEVKSEHRPILVTANRTIWREGDWVYSGPCYVQLKERRGGTWHTLIGWCDTCDEEHLIDRKQLGKRWKREPSKSTDARMQRQFYEGWGQKRNTVMTEDEIDEALDINQIKDQEMHVDRKAAINKVHEQVTEFLNGLDGVTVVDTADGIGNKQLIYLYLDDDEVKGSPVGVEVMVGSNNDVEGTMQAWLEELKNRQKIREQLAGHDAPGGEDLDD